MFSDLIENKRIGGVNCLIWQDGKVLYRVSEGCKNIETKEPFAEDTLFRIASMTKPVTSVLTMILYEEGKLLLEDPITKWFPQFKHMRVLKNQSSETFEEANREITILDLLTHRAGFTYSGFLKGERRAEYLRVLGADIDTDLTNEQWVNGLASLPLVSQPGEIFNYGRSTDLLGMLIAKIEGKPLSMVMNEKIFGPLSMTDSFFVVPADKKSRCASNIGFDESGNLVNLETVPAKMAYAERPAGLEYESGGQGLWSTLDDYLRFARIFIEDGSSDGVRLLSKANVDLICSNHLTSAQREHSKMMGSSMFRDNVGFGLGVAVVMVEASNLSIPCTGSVGSVGWPGAYGGWWSADRAKKTVSIFLTHSMAELHQLGQGIGFGVYEAIDILGRHINANL